MLPVCMMKECAFTVLMKVYHAKHLTWTHMLVAHTKFAHTTGTQFPMQTGCSGLCGLSIPLPGSVDELIACWQLHMQGCNRLMASCVSMFFFQKKKPKQHPRTPQANPDKKYGEAWNGPGLSWLDPLNTCEAHYENSGTAGVEWWLDVIGAIARKVSGQDYGILVDFLHVVRWGLDCEHCKP